MQLTEAMLVARYWFVSPEIEAIIMCCHYDGAIRISDHPENDFPLRHGGRSPLYLNLRLKEYSKEGNGLTHGQGIVLSDQTARRAKEKGMYFDCVTGVPAAADPFAERIAHVFKKPFYPLTKNLKDGSVAFAALRPPKGSAILLVENVTTTAGETVKVAQFLTRETQSHYVVRDVLTGADRHSGAKKRLASLGVRLTWNVSLYAILSILFKNKSITLATCNRILEHARNLRLQRAPQ